MARITINIEAESAEDLLRELRDLAQSDPVYLPAPSHRTATVFEEPVDPNVCTDPVNTRSEPDPDADVYDGPEIRREEDADDVDVNGVAFNADYCGQAAEPFYGSGPRKGQWKKKRGVSDADYDRWYAVQKAKASAEEPVTEEPVTEEPATDPRAAFGKPASLEPPPADGYPADIGAFTAWTSERMAAGRVTQADIDRAFAETGAGYHQIMPGVEGGADVIAKLCRAIESYGE